MNHSFYYVYLYINNAFWENHWYTSMLKGIITDWFCNNMWDRVFKVYCQEINVPIKSMNGNTWKVRARCISQRIRRFKWPLSVFVKNTFLWFQIKGTKFFYDTNKNTKSFKYIIFFHFNHKSSINMKLSKFFPIALKYQNWSFQWEDNLECF